jgi:FkbM family methyltransferase
MHWFDDPMIYGRLPALYRAYASYCRLVGNRQTGLVRGGSLLFKVVVFLTNTFGLATEANVQVDGLEVFVDLCDHRIFWVFAELRPATHERRILQATLKPGDSFLDLGANHGSYSLIAARLVGPGGAVIAFEPQPRLAALLRKSFAANGFRQARVVEAACGDRAAETTLFIPAVNSGTASLHGSYSALGDHHPVRVRLIRVDDEVECPSLPGRVFVKVDTEGSDLAALRGAEKVLRCRRPTILFELNPTSAGAAGETVGELFEFLESTGYREFAEIESFPRTHTANEMNVDRQRNVVAVP